VEISFWLAGGMEFPPCTLTAKQADELLEQTGTETYQYVHAICPFVIDPWNYRTDDRVLLCYYKDFGELTEPPMSLDELKGRWKMFSKPNPFDPKFIMQDVYFGSNFTLCDCCVCLEPLGCMRNVWRCGSCLKFLHVGCMREWAKKTGEPFVTCPHCNSVVS
jgi:hypothetical protein